MNDCLFCKILRDEIPSVVVYEDEYFKAIKDIYPQAPFHIIILLKEHIEKPADITSENCNYIGQAALAAAEIAKQEGLTDGYRLVLNSGSMGGQTVNHIHMHMLSGRNLGWPPG